MTEVTVFFDGWGPFVRILVVGVGMYAALVILLRVSGSRTLSSMNAFDFIVTVAIGAVFGRALTAKDVALTEAMFAFALLVSLQYVVSWLKARSSGFQLAVTNPPRLLYFRDEFLQGPMVRQRVTADELRAAVRKKGFGSMDDVEAVVLESSGEFSIVRSIDHASALDETIRDQRPDRFGDDPSEPAE